MKLLGKEAEAKTRTYFLKVSGCRIMGEQGSKKSFQHYQQDYAQVSKRSRFHDI